LGRLKGWPQYPSASSAAATAVERAARFSQIARIQEQAGQDADDHGKATSAIDPAWYRNTQERRIASRPKRHRR
jgi:hypothetical protein